LNPQPNSLDPDLTPPGSLMEATNVIIKRDGVIESRRGYQLYGQSFGDENDRAKQLAVYKNRILRHFATSLQYDTGTTDTSGNEIFNTFAGSYTEPQTGRRIRFIEANSNFYFTTSNGVQKISASDPSQFTTADGYITNAGGINALDLTATLDVTTGSQTGYMTQDAGVEYRVLWNTIDVNDNLIYGSPSEPVTIYNPLLSLLLRDFMNLLGALDDTANNSSNPSLITFNQFVETYGLSTNATGIELQENLINLTEELDADIVYADQVSVAPLQISGSSISNGVASVAFTNTGVDPNDYFVSGQSINLSGFTPTTGTLDGPETVSSVFNTFTTTGNESSGTAQVTTVATGADYSQSLAGSYFTLNNANNVTEYYVWYQVSSAGNDPALPGKTGIQVSLTTNDDAATVASQTSAAILGATSDFSITTTSSTINISNISVANPTLVTTLTPHGLATGDTITISGSNSTPSIDGSQTVTVLNSTQFTVPVDVTVAGSAGSFTISNLLTITNANVGPSIDATAGTTVFTVNTTTSGVANNVLTNLADISGIFVGSLVSGTGIPSYTYVTAIGAAGPNTVTISSGINVNNTGVTFTFGPGITFLTSATGLVSVVSATINSNTFTNITQPAVPDSPATDAELVALQTYLRSILTALQTEPTSGTTPVISPDSMSKYISGLSLTTTANVVLRITIPQGVTTNDFFQIYRSPQAIATGPSVIQTDVSPSDELQQVYEAYPTNTDISNGYIIVTDDTPDAFLGAFLYTDAANGTGILSANQAPPYCVDMNYFKNCMFYANTRSPHQLTINLLGVAKMITDFNNSITPLLMITDGIHTTTYNFATGTPQITDVVTKAASTLNSSGAASYFTINSAENQTQYYVWYELGTATDPAPAGLTGIRVSVNSGDNANTVALKTNYTIARYNYDFITTVSGDDVTITTVGDGITSASAAGTSGFTVTTTQSGTGENAATNTVLLSTSESPATAVDETARSLVRIINQNADSSVNAYYLSSSLTVPGQISLQERTLSSNPFYVIANDENVGTSFNPDLSPSDTITNITAANPTVITATSHGLTNLDQVLIIGSNSTPNIDGLYTATVIDANTFSIPVHVTVAGTTGSIRAADGAPVSDDQVLPNRIYYSQYLQPEAVPLVNTIDVGAKDKAILRIFPLRDSLFVFKEDGLFRISGEVAPFNLALFDSSVILIAPDSVDVQNNLVFAWTTKGIHTVSEAGVNIISRPIDTLVLPLATTQYTNFNSATWGIGYESDNSYTVYTVSSTDDTYATIAYRYSTLTNTWSVFDKTDTCGVINSADDLQYLGAGDTNYIEQERKNFDRTDYADREIDVQLAVDAYFGTQLLFTGLSNVDVGDVLVQEQLLTVYGYNNLLQKMDTDVTLTHTYTENLEISAGVDLRTAVDALINQVANDSKRLAQSGATAADVYEAFETIEGTGTITNISAADPTVITCDNHNLQTGRVITISGSNSTPSIDGTYQVTVIDDNTFSVPVSVTVPGTSGSFFVDNEDFRDIQTSFNSMINTMNTDLGCTFHNYSTVTETTIQEAIITSIQSVNNANSNIYVNYALDFVVGPITIYNSIPTSVTWAPQTLNDPLGLKHMREATLMFQNKAFTTATMSFSTDLLPAYIPITIPGDGNGIFGFTGTGVNMPNSSGGNPGFGGNFFGGISNSAPFRTYIPRNCQRCRYLNCQFQHQIAREEFAIYGLSLTGEISQSTRAYR
jgi:hypothetical protein